MERLIADAAKLDSSIQANDLSFGNIVKAINAVQTEMGITGTTALEAGRTISGSVGAMKSAWSNLITGLADGNADIGQLVDNLVTTIVGDGTENNLGVLGNIMPAVKMALKGAAKVVAQSAPIIAEELPKLMEEILPDLASATANLIVALAEQIPSMAQTLVDAAFQIVDEIGNAFSEKIPGLSVIFENLETVVISLTAAFGAYKLAMAISGIIDALRKATEGQTLAQTLLNAVMNANPFVLVATLIAGLVAALVTLWNTNEGFRESIIKVWEDVKTAFSSAWKVITSLWENAGSFFSGVWENIKNAFSNVGSFFENTFNVAKNYAVSAWSNVKSEFSTIWSKVKGAFSDVSGWFSTTFQSAKTSAVNAWSNVKSSFSTIWSNIKGVFTNALTEFSGIGRNIVSGVWAGIQSSWSTFYNNVKSFFSNIVSSVKGVLGIRSPSRVFRDQIGKQMAAGVGVGFEDEFSRVKDDIDDALNFDDASIGINASIRKVGAGAAGGAFGGGNISIVQNIYSKPQTAADLMMQARYQAEQAVFLSV